MRRLVLLTTLVAACAGPPPERPMAEPTPPAVEPQASAQPAVAPTPAGPPLQGPGLVPVVPPYTDATWQPPPQTRSREEAREEGQSEKTLTEYLSPGRDSWNKPDKVLELMAIEPGMILADVGAGSGYFTFRLAAAAGPEGRVYAPDVDPLAIDMLQARVPQDWDATTMAEIRSYICPGHTPWLPMNAVDRALFVDVHYYTADPLPHWGLQSLQGLLGGMKPGGLVHVIEGHVEQAGDPPETITPRGDAIRRNFEAAGFTPHAEHAIFDDHFYHVFQRPGA